jgi:hypothetical protein
LDKIPAPADHPWLEAALEAASALGLSMRTVQRAPKPGRTHGDTMLGIQHSGREVLFAVEVNPALRPGSLGAALHQIERLGKPAILVTDHVSPALADALKERGVAFLDAAGNAYIEQANLLIWVKGQKPAAKPAAPAFGRAFQPTGLQLLFTLLCNPQAVNRPYRELAAMAGVAHGTVGWAMPDLQQLGYVRDSQGQRGTRRLVQRERLLAQWADTYARVLRPRTLLGRYYVPTLDDWKSWPVAEHGALWGGEPAAAGLGAELRPAVLTIYPEKLPAQLAARQKFKREPAPGHAAVVEVRKRFWNFAGDPARPTLAPPLLIYADLLATGEARCIDAAKMIYDAHLTGLIGDD